MRHQQQAKSKCTTCTPAPVRPTTSHHHMSPSPMLLINALLIMLISSSEDSASTATLFRPAFASKIPPPTTRDRLPRDLLRQDSNYNARQSNIVLPIYSQSGAPASHKQQMPQSASLLSGSPSLSTVSSTMSPTTTTMSQSATIRTVNPGDRINIPCSLANPGGSIQFAKDDQPIILDSGCAHCQLDISNDGQASLTINRVNSKDEGHWQCWRLDENGNIKQKISIIQLVVTNSPELPILLANGKELIGGSSSEATMTVKENEIVEFRCIIKGASPPIKYVHWMLDSAQNITHLSQLMMEYSGNNNNYLTKSILKLNATKAMNLKSISCLSDHQLWTAPMTVTAFLNVLYEPSFTISREPGFGIPVSEGMSVMLKCEIDSNPSSSPVWIKDAEKAQPNVGQQQPQAGSDSANPNTSGAGTAADANTSLQKEAEPTVLDTQEDGSVIFWPVQRSDSGWYRCKTENKYGNFSSFGYYLNVRAAANSPSGAPNPAQQQASPSYQTSTQATNNNNNIQYPQNRNDQPITRHVSGGPQQAAGSRPAIEPNQFVQATNNNNRLSSMAHPSQANQADALRSPMGAPSGYPPAGLPGGLQQQQLSNKWMQQQQANNNNGRMQETTTMSSDQYQMNAAPGAFNQQRAPASLQSVSSECNNIGAPVIEQPNSTVTGVLNRPLSLSVRFCCNPKPKKVFWIHRHLAMIPGRIFGPYVTRELWTTWNSLFCYTSTFEIEAAKTDDIGTVYFVVGNDRGLADAQITINLTNRGSDMIPSGKYLSGSGGAMVSPNGWVALLSAIVSLGYYYCFVCFDADKSDHRHLYNR